MASTFCQEIVSINSVFVTKLNILHISEHTILFKFHQHVIKILDWTDLKLPISALAIAAQRSFNNKFTAKIDFPLKHFMLPLLMLTLEVNGYISIHYLISIWWNLNKIEWSEKCKILSCLPTCGRHVGRCFSDKNHYFC